MTPGSSVTALQLSFHKLKCNQVTWKYENYKVPPPSLHELHTESNNC